MESTIFNLGKKMRKVNWKLTPELHLDDGREYGGGVWLYFHRDVSEFIEEVEKQILRYTNPKQPKDLDLAKCILRDIKILAGDKFK